MRLLPHFCGLVSLTSLVASTILQNGQVRITNYPNTTIPSISPNSTGWKTYGANATELSYKGRWDSKHISWWAYAHSPHMLPFYLHIFHSSHILHFLGIFPCLEILHCLEILQCLELLQYHEIPPCLELLQYHEIPPCLEILPPSYTPVPSHTLLTVYIQSFPTILSYTLQN
jgi:hypothetical protein